MRQGEVLRLPLLSLGRLGRGEARVSRFLRDVVLISQTCDIVRDHITSVLVADVVRLPPDQIAIAESGKNIRFLPIPGTSPRLFANLDRLTVIPKKRAAAGIEFPGQDRDFSASDEWVFGRRFARRYQRFAFPDDVADFFKPLVDLVKDRYLRPQSAIGRVFHEVVDLRIEKPGDWDEDPLSLTLVVVLDSEKYDGIDEVTDLPTGAFPSNLKAACSAVATKIDEEADVNLRFRHWVDLSQLFARLCAEDYQPSGRQLAVDVDLLLSSELTLDRINESVPLDLDFLSYEGDAA